MTAVSPTECGVCQENFDEAARCPRILECFHYLCTDCIHQIIQSGSNKCPFCRNDFQAKSAADVKINLGVLELIRYISGINLHGLPAQPTESPSESKNVIQDFKKESSGTCTQLLIDCIEAQHQIEHMISETKEVMDAIQEKNSTIQEKLLSKVNQMMVDNNKKVNELNGIWNKLQNQLKEVKEKHTQLQDVKWKLDVSSTLKDAATNVVRAEETNTTVDKWIETFEQQVFKDEETLCVARKELGIQSEKVATVLDILESPDNTATQKSSTSNIVSSAILGNMTWRITVADLKELSEPMKRLVDQGKVFAVQKQCWIRRTARITISGEKLLLHHLKEGQRLLNVLKLEYPDVMSLVNAESRLVFLELAAHGLTLGRVYIRLSPDTQRAKFFSLLCTGELGYSYADKRFLEVGFKTNEWEFIRAGDYELDSGMGGKWLLPDPLTEVLEQRPWLAGTVEAVWGKGADVASQFVIRTRSNPGFVCPLAYGIVEEGLDVVRTAIRCYDNIGDVRIKDCGIVLSSILSKQDHQGGGGTQVSQTVQEKIGPDKDCEPVGKNLDI